MIAFIFSALNSKRVINNFFITLNHFASPSAISAFSDAENGRFIKAGTENDLFRGANNKVSLRAPTMKSSPSLIARQQFFQRQQRTV